MTSYVDKRLQGFSCSVETKFNFNNFVKLHPEFANVDVMTPNGRIFMQNANLAYSKVLRDKTSSMIRR